MNISVAVVALSLLIAPARVNTSASSPIIRPYKTSLFPNTALSIAGEESVTRDIKAVRASPAPIHAYTCRIRVFCLTTTWDAVRGYVVLNSFIDEAPFLQLFWRLDQHSSQNRDCLLIDTSGKFAL